VAGAFAGDTSNRARDAANSLQQDIIALPPIRFISFVFVRISKKFGLYEVFSRSEKFEADY
jgi:hypothetical protein